MATAFSDAGYSVNISTNTEIGSKVYNLSFSADPSETVELQLQGISNYFELKEGIFANMSSGVKNQDLELQCFLKVK